MAHIPKSEDGNAFHGNGAGELSALTEKVTPVAGDHLLIEDSAAGDVKRRVQVGSLPSGGGSGDVVGPASATDDAIAVYDGTTGKLLKDSTGTIAQIAANTAKISYTDAAAVAANTAKISYTDAAAVALNTAKVTNATHTGDVTGGAALTIADGAVTLPKLADIATDSILGRATAATGDPEVLTAAQARAVLNTDELTDDRTADGIRTLTTVVATSTTAAPTSGQVLTALTPTLGFWQTPSNAVHALGGADHTADTLSNLNTKISDATLIDTADARLSDERTANAIATTGSDVAVDAAAPPTVGQALIATSPTVASWQDVVGGAVAPLSIAVLSIDSGLSADTAVTSANSTLLSGARIDYSSLNFEPDVRVWLGPPATIVRVRSESASGTANTVYPTGTASLGEFAYSEALSAGDIVIMEIGGGTQVVAAVDSVTPGAGLTNSGTTADPVLDIGAGTGVTVNASSIEVDHTTTNHNLLQNYEATRHREFLHDIAANRPAAGTSGRYFLATDTVVLSYDDGATWTDIGGAGGSGDVTGGTASVASEIATYSSTTGKAIARSDILVSGGSPTVGTRTLSGSAVLAGGVITTAGTISATSHGAVALGAVTSGLLTATGQGSTALGFANGASTAVTAGALGAFAQGTASGGASAITASSGGSLAHGSAANGGTIIASTGAGSTAMGSAEDSGTSILASGEGALAFGVSSQLSSGTGAITASGAGAFAGGDAIGLASAAAITASNLGAFAFGYTGFNGTISATAQNAFQFGVGTNANANSFQVGNGTNGIRLMAGGVANATNGSMWVDGSGNVVVRSGGADVTI